MKYLRTLSQGLGIGFTVLTLALFAPNLYAAQSVDIVPVNKKIVDTDVDVTGTATKLPSTALKGRKALVIQNISGVNIFLGDSGVTTSTGLRLQDGESISLDLGEDVDLYGIAASGTNDTRVLEIR